MTTPISSYKYSEKTSKRLVAREIKLANDLAAHAAGWK